MRRRIIVAGLIASAIAAINASPFAVPMDPLGVGYTPTPTTINAAGPTATPEQATHAAQAKHAATIVAGIGLVPTTSGVPESGGTAGAPARGVLGVAGATAERFGESAPAGLAVRRHRAPSSLLNLVITTAGRRGVPHHILAGLAEDESSWQVDAVSPDGEEVGLLQLKKGTAAWCGKVDRLNAAQNVDCGARYLYAQFETFGSWELALSAYKAGPSRIPEDIPAQAWVYVQRTLAKAEAYR